MPLSHALASAFAPLQGYRLAFILCPNALRATSWASTPGRIQTCNQRIRNPLLYPLSYGREG